MGVFDKYWKRPEVEDTQEVINKTIDRMNGSDKVSCRSGHEWSGVIPTIDPAILQIQHPELIGNPCDCKRALYYEEICGCSAASEQKWEIKLKENTGV